MGNEVSPEYYERLIAGDDQEDLNESINVTHPFNRMLVDAGHAQVKDYTTDDQILDLFQKGIYPLDTFWDTNDLLVIP